MSGIDVNAKGSDDLSPRSEMDGMGWKHVGYEMGRMKFECSRCGNVMYSTLKPKKPCGCWDEDGVRLDNMLVVGDGDSAPVEWSCASTDGFENGSADAEAMAYISEWELSEAARVLRMYEDGELYREEDVGTCEQIALGDVLPMDADGMLIRPGDMMSVDGRAVEATWVGAESFVSRMPDGTLAEFPAHSHHAVCAELLGICERCRESGCAAERGEVSYPPSMYVDEIMELLRGYGFMD